MIVIRSTAIVVPTGIRIVVLRETGWAGVVNEKSLKPRWCASLGTVKDCFGLEIGKIVERVTHFRFL